VPGLCAFARVALCNTWLWRLAEMDDGSAGMRGLTWETKTERLNRA